MTITIHEALRNKPFYIDGNFEFSTIHLMSKFIGIYELNLLQKALKGSGFTIYNIQYDDTYKDGSLSIILKKNKDIEQ